MVGVEGLKVGLRGGMEGYVKEEEGDFMGEERKGGMIEGYVDK